jgi:hypothetical protein
MGESEQVRQQTAIQQPTRQASTWLMRHALQPYPILCPELRAAKPLVSPLVSLVDLVDLRSNKSSQSRITLALAAKFSNGIAFSMASSMARDLPLPQFGASIVRSMRMQGFWLPKSLLECPLGLLEAVLNSTLSPLFCEGYRGLS